MLLQHKFFPFADQAAEIISHAESSPDREICGGILKDGSVLPIENTSLSPDEFEMGEEFEQYRPRVAAIYHSHVGIDVAAQLSRTDIANSKELLIPYLVYHPQFRQWDYFDPTAIHPYPMELRSDLSPQQLEYYLLWRFQYDRCDCGSIVRAWYHGMLGIELQDYRRSRFSRNHDQFSIERFQELGFELIPDKNEFATHDVVVFDYEQGRANHIGVIASMTYNQLLHNPGEGAYSTVVNYGSDWRDRARYVFRHKVLVEEFESIEG